MDGCDQASTIKRGVSLVVQSLRLRAANSGGLGLMPSQETRSHMPQLKTCMIPHATTEIKDLECHN